MGQGIELVSDASGLAADVIALQNGRIVRCFSKSLIPARASMESASARPWPSNGAWSMEHFSHLMHGRTKIYTDHKPLVVWLRRESGDVLLDRWSLALQRYDLDIIYVVGKSNLADGLSRVIPGNSVLHRESPRLIFSDSNWDRESLQTYGLEEGHLTYHGKRVPPQQGRQEWLAQLHLDYGHVSASALDNIIKQEFDWEGRNQDVKASSLLVINVNME
jgi:hypothetical protein